MKGDGSMKRLHHLARLAVMPVVLTALTGCPPTLIPGQTRTFDGIEFQWCPPRTFLMGSPVSEVGGQENETHYERGDHLERERFPRSALVRSRSCHAVLRFPIIAPVKIQRRLQGILMYRRIAVLAMVIPVGFGLTSDTVQFVLADRPQAR